MSTPTDTATALATAYKSTLAQLSHLLAFQHRIQQQGATHYAASVGPPRDLVNRVNHEAAHFDQLCADLEARILRAIAVLERDARKAAGLPNPVAPSPLPAPLPAAPLSNPVPPSNSPSIDLTLPGADAEDDGAPLPFSLPISTAGKGAQPAATGAAGGAMELDLTLSPSPPPSTSRPATAAGGGAGAAEAPLPFQLPVSTSSSSTPSAATAAPPLADPAGRGGGDDDLNALLSSLNMPPFDPSSSLSSSLASSIPPSAVPAPLPALATQPDFSTPEGLMAFLSSSTSSNASAPPVPVSAQQAAQPSLDFSALGLSSAPSAHPLAAAAAAPQPDLNNLGLGSLDFSALLSSSSSVTSSAPPPLADVGGGVADFDFSSLTNDPTGGLGEFDFASAAFGGGGGGESGAADLDELLRNLG
ncbi:hypothetical protein JCM8097_001501 [Rhodosporidiobolus ruineniae]